MYKETLFKVLFKCDDKGEEKFTEFSQLTSAGRHITLVKLSFRRKYQEIH